MVTSDHLVGKKHGAKNRVDEAERLEVPAVSTGDERGNDRRLGQLDEPRDVRLPGAVGHDPVAHLEMGDLARGKDDQSPAGTDVTHGILQGGGIGAFRITEDVHGDEVLSQEAHATEDLVHDDLDVRASPLDQGKQRHRVVPAHGMVGGDDDRSLGGNVFELFLRTVDGQIEILDVGTPRVDLLVDHAIGETHLDPIDLL